VAEVSVYVHSDFKNKGAGQNLLNALIFESEANNIWTLQSGIFPENGASVALHEKSGFRQIGLRERVGKLNGTWRDTLLLERRSNIIGIE
jgi:phosphinothricin acetyltransferase